MTVNLIVLIIVAIWLSGLSFGVFWVLNKFRVLTHGVEEGNLIKVLDRVLKAEASNAKEIKLLEKELNNLGEEVTLHVQKVGLVRFNPFDELGGEHSFSLALLDGKDTGFVLTGLHTRERTRIYIKSIKRGKSEYDLGNEEKKALERAKKAR